MKKIRAVLDTNALVSLLLTTSSLAEELRELWLEGAFELALSASILEEFRRVARYPRIRDRFALNEDQIDAFALALATSAEWTQESHPVEIVHEDPEDNKILACALEAQARYIVTRDQHLKKIGRYQDIEIIDPERFREILRQSGH